MSAGSNTVFPGMTSFTWHAKINKLLLSWSIQIKLITCQTKLLLKFQCWWFLLLCGGKTSNTWWLQHASVHSNCSERIPIERWDKIDFPFRVGEHFRRKYAGWLAGVLEFVFWKSTYVRTYWIYFTVGCLECAFRTRWSIWISTKNTYETFTPYDERAIETLVEFYWNNFSWGITMGMWLFPLFCS